VSDETIAEDAGLPKLQQSPDSFPLGPTPARPFLRAITLLSRHDGGGPVVLEPVPLVEAVLDWRTSCPPLPEPGRTRRRPLS